MKIGFLGASTVGKTLAEQFIQIGHEVVLSNSRGPASLAAIVKSLGPKASAGTTVEAASAPVVVLAVPWPEVAKVLSGLRNWDGRILVDATNIFLSYAPHFEVADLGDDTGSEMVARLAPGARLVKVFNTLPITDFFKSVEPRHAKRVAVLAGDNSEAKTQIQALILAMGLAVIDLGRLRTGGILMQLGGALNGVNLVKVNQ